MKEEFHWRGLSLFDVKKTHYDLYACLLIWIIEKQTYKSIFQPGLH